MQLALFFSALVFSALGTVAGFGGGVFLVPLMIIVFRIPVETAIGITALSLFPSSLLSSLLNLRKQSIDFRLLVALELPTFVGAFAGAHLTGLLPARPLELIFSLFMMVLAWKTFRPSARPNLFTGFVAFLNGKGPIAVKGAYQVSVWSAGIFGTASGIIAGLFGIGGGILKTPIMINVFKVPVRTATSTALGMIVFTSLISGFTHYQLGHVDLHYFWPCAAGFMAGAIGGQFITVKINEQMIKKIIAASIFLAGLVILFQAK